jgi:hypothetical protein
LGGVIKLIAVDNRLINVTWDDNDKEQRYLDKIANTLTKGNYADGILLLELFLSEESNNTDLLYNLGMAYSDQKICVLLNCLQSWSL